MYAISACVLLLGQTDHIRPTENGVISRSSVGPNAGRSVALTLQGKYHFFGQASRHSRHVRNMSTVSFKVPRRPDNGDPGLEECPPGVRTNIDALASPDHRVYHAASTALIEMGPHAIRWLDVAYQSHPDNDVRLASVAILREIGTSEIIDTMKVAANDADPVIRRLAAESFVFADDASQVVPILCKMLKRDEDRRVRICASRTLGNLGPPARTAIPELLHVCSSDDVASRYFALIATAQIGEHLSSVIPVLRDGLRDAHPVMRAQSAYASSLLGMRASVVIPDLAELLADAEAEVRYGAAFALNAMAPMSIIAIPELVGVLEDSDDLVRECALAATLNAVISWTTW